MAIQGVIKKELTRENILNLITSFDIYKHFMPYKWELNKLCTSPFGKDNTPSFIIGTKFGEITHATFNGNKEKGDCFNFVSQLHGCSYIESLRLIDKEFGLNIYHKDINIKRKEIIYSQPEIIEKKYSTIQCITRKFTKEELKYWAEYFQDIEDLKKENIYSISKIFLNKERFPINMNELRFGYLYNDLHWKIYTPFSINKKMKWAPNNIPLTTMGGKQNIINCDTAIVTKSLKDRMVIQKIYPCVCDVQNESAMCFSEENVKFLKDNSKRQILNFDNDATGVKNSQQITKLFGFDYINLPRSYMSDGLSDFSDVAKAYGLNTVEKILKRKKIII